MRWHTSIITNTALLLITLATLLLSSSTASNPLTDDSSSMSRSDLEWKIQLLEKKLLDTVGQIQSLSSFATPIVDSNTLPLSTSPRFGEEELTVSQRKTLICIALIVVTGIVGISIAFDKGKEFAEENIIEVLKPVLRTVFGELTILGFIGLIMFVVTKYGKPALDFLACQDKEGWWGDNEEVCPINITSGKWEPGIAVPENPLIELTETAHMILFLVMMLFLFESFVLIERSMSHIREWKDYENLCVTHSISRALHEEKEAHELFLQQSWFTRKCGYYFLCCPCLRMRTHPESYKIRQDYFHKTGYLRYAALRSTLIKSFNRNAEKAGNEDHVLQGDFDFCEYQVKVLADKLSEIVELSTGNWLVLWGVFCIFLAADYIDLITSCDTMLLSGMSILACYLSCLTILQFQNKAHYIRNHLIHPWHLHHGSEVRKKVAEIKNRFQYSATVNTAVSKFMSNRSTSNSINTPLLNAHGGGGTSDATVNTAVSKFMSNRSTSNSINTPLLNAHGGGGTSDATNDGTSDGMSDGETKVDVAAESGRLSSMSVKDQLIQQAGVISASYHEEEHLPLYMFHIDGTERDVPEEFSLCGCFLRHQPDPHEALFWGGKYGEGFFYGYIRTQMVLVALYLGTFVVVFRPAIVIFFQEYGEEKPEPGGGGGGGMNGGMHGFGHEDDNNKYTNLKTWGPIGVCFVAIIPLAFMLYELSELIPELIRITTTEEMVDHEAINQVLRIMKSRRALRALHNISCFMADVDKMADMCRARALESSTFALLTEEEREELMLDCEMHNFTAGHTIIQQGQINHSLYIVSQGEVRVIVNGVVVNVLSAGKEFGETSMLKGNLCNASVITAKPTACLSLNKETFEKHLRGKNKAREAMIDATGAKKLFKVKSHNRSSSGMLTKEGRRGSLMKVVNVKAKVSGLSASDLSDFVAPEQAKETKTPSTKQSDSEIEKWIQKGVMVDTNGDGQNDTMGFDTNGDGQIDAYLIDTNGDGKKNALGFDTNHDGKIDMIDEDLDGHADHSVNMNDFVEGIRVSDGKLSLYAQLRLTRTQEALELQRRTALTDLFHAIDSGGDGSIEEEELVEFLSKIFPPSDNKDMQDKQIKMMIQGLDEDGDGDVTLPEFLHMMEPIVIRAEMEETSDEVCERMFQMLDDDQSDSVSISEFLEMLRKVGMDMSYEEVRDLFNEYDDSNDGAIDLEEFQKMMAHQL